MEGNPSFKDVVNQAYMDRVSLSEHGFYKTPVSGYNFKTGEVSVVVSFYQKKKKKKYSLFLFLFFFFFK